MKVLYINNYSEGTGWSNAGLGYILALDAAGVDVVPRRLYFSGDNVEIPEIVRDLENRSSKGCTDVIYHTLPHLIQYNGNFHRNCALFAAETSNFLDSGWLDNLLLMDRVLVPSEFTKKICENSGITKKVRVVPHAFDPLRYQKSYGKLPLPVPSNHFIFYFVGEFSRRKNLGALIKAFHAEFEPYEPVELLLKVNKPASTPESLMGEVGQFCKDVKMGLKKFRNIEDYKPELIVTSRLSDDELMQLHETCHCFVSTSHGEAFCIPAYEAMAMGRNVIGGPMGDFLTEDTGYLINTIEEPCFGAFDTFQNLYTYNEDWQEYPIRELRKAMRDAFSKRTQKDGIIRNLSNRNTIRRTINNFSYDTVGQILKEAFRW